MDATSPQALVVFIGLVLLFTAVGFVAGTATGGGGGPGAAASGDDVSEDEIRETADRYVQQQLGRQRQQLRVAANRSQNLSSDDVSIGADVTEVSPSRIGSLYRVNFSVTGDVPRRVGGGTQEIQQTGSIYVSGDGRFIFQRPIDLENPPQPSPRRRQPPTGP